MCVVSPEVKKSSFVFSIMSDFEGTPPGGWPGPCLHFSVGGQPDFQLVRTTVRTGSHNFPRLFTLVQIIFSAGSHRFTYF